MRSFIAIIFFTLLALTASPVCAQWTEVSPNLVQPEAQRSGALRFRDGVAWAGTSSLFFSSDTGVTWNQVSSFPAFSGITDIEIYDSLNVFVSTLSDGLFLTTDGGQGWQNFDPTGTQSTYVQVAFDGSPNILHALDYDASIFFTSTDGGATWTNSDPTSSQSAGSLSFAIAADKTIYVFSYSGSNGWVNASTDNGQTWGADSFETDGDSNTLSADSCNAKMLYLVNENTVQRIDGQTRIDVTTDAGADWTAASSVALDFYSGSLASTGQVLYVGTVPDGGKGVERSTNSGKTWSAIGGPTEEFDTRSIAAINNNIVLVLDANGSVWRTMNSGGDSLALPAYSSTKLLALSSQPAVLSERICNMPTDTFIPVGIIGCGSPTGSLDSVWVTGASALQIADSRTLPRVLGTIDSVRVSYAGSSVPDTATLHIRYDFGSSARDTTFLLIGSVTSPLITQPAQLHRENASAYIGQIISLTLGVDVSASVNLDSLWPFITGIQASYTWDSAVVSFDNYQAPSGWSLNSVTSTANTANFDIQNLSSQPTQPLNLGAALFHPLSTQIATTWVTLTNLTLDINNQAFSLCVTDGEDNHWAVQTLGEASEVTQIPVAVQNISLYPNPANDNVWITSSADLGNVTIEIYNMLGTQESTVSGTLNKENPIELLLPARSGVYTIMIRSISGTTTLRVVREK